MRTRYLWPERRLHEGWQKNPLNYYEAKTRSKGTQKDYHKHYQEDRLKTEVSRHKPKPYHLRNKKNFAAKEWMQRLDHKLFNQEPFKIQELDASLTKFRKNKTPGPDEEDLDQMDGG